MPQRDSFAEVEGRLLRALLKVRKYDSFLLKHDVHEISITHKLAIYLRSEFPRYNIDIEYNRHGRSTKRIPPRTLEGEFNRTRNEPGDLVRPDIVIHKRDNDLSDLLVIEAKKQKWDDDIPQKDIDTLSWLTEPNNYGDHDFGYQHGLFLAFDGATRVQMVWFHNGHEDARRTFDVQRIGKENMQFVEVSA